MEYFRGLLRPHFPPPQQAPQMEPIRADTLAKMADGAYDRGADRQDQIDGFSRMNDKALRDKGIDPGLLHTPSGMHADVFRDEHDGRTVVSFRGTDMPKVEVVNRPFEGPSGLDPEMDMIGALRGSEPSLKFSGFAQSARDWVTNFGQGLGWETQQHNDTVTLAKQCDVAFGDKLVFTGHSKGGGQAELASAVVDKPAMTFNPAGIHDATLSRYSIDPVRGHELARERITSVVTQGEAVDFIQGREFMGLKTPVAMGQRVDIVPNDSSLNMVSRHLMNPGILPQLDQLQGRQIEMPRQPLFDEMNHPFRFPLHGGLGEMLERIRQEARAPNLSSESHPGNGLYQQALEKVQAHGESGQDAMHLAGALTVAAQKSGITQIEEVRSIGDKYFAMQGEVGLPTSRVGGVDIEGAKQTSLAESSRESAGLPQQVSQTHDDSIHKARSMV